MHLIVALTLFLCAVEANNDAKTTQPPDKYPLCDNKILFGFDNSINVNDVPFQRQIDFLTNYTFEKWNYFDQLALLRTGDLDFKIFGTVNSKTELVVWDNKTCRAFSFLSGQLENTRIILLSNEFTLSDITNICVYYLKQLVLSGNAFAFVPLSSDFNTTVLEYYFKKVKIIKWDITDSETPSDWEEQFDEFYNCGALKTTTIASTTEPTISYPPCDTAVTFAFDKSNSLNDDQYRQQQNFLINYVFQNWTNLYNLNLYSFDDRSYSNIMPFNDKNELVDFILGEEKSNRDHDLCNIFENFESIEDPILIFLNKLNETDLSDLVCQKVESFILNNLITFVLLNDEISVVDMLRMYLPQSQFIKLDLTNNLEWQFNTAYGCNEDDADDQEMFPCKSKFIFGYDVSSEVDKNAIKEFLINDVFNQHWNVFDNLALIAYSNETMIQDFGTLTSLNDIYNFIGNTFEQNNANATSLCQVFKEISRMYLKDVNIILFISSFHGNEGDECSIWTKQLRNNINSIHFIALNRSVNTEYLASKFAQATFTSWDTKSEERPNNWNTVTSCGCQNFIVNATTYPCYPRFNTNIVIYEKSHYLSPFEYERLTKFLMLNVFIKQWSALYSIYNYPDSKQITMASSRSFLEFFIRQNLRSNNEPLFCEILNNVKGSELSSNLLFFVSKFDETNFIPNQNCKDIIQNINSNPTKTFFKLGQLVNETLLQATFPNAKIVNWDIETEEVPVDWNEMLWKAFGCPDSSPIIFPHSTSTAPESTTKALTTTGKSSSKSISTTYKQTTSLITTTTLAHTAFSKTTKTSNNSKEATILLGVFIPLIIIILIGVIIFVCFYQHRQRRKLIDNMVFSNLNKLYSTFNKNRENDRWEIDIEYVNINFIEKLGSGAFCDVFNGKLLIESPAKEIHNDSRYQRFYNCDVAVKTLPAIMQSDRSAMKEFQNELELMKTLTFHNNVVCFLGFVNNCENSLMLLEYCGNGDLLNFIRTNKQMFIDNFESQDTTNCKSLLSFAWQISNGLEYLGGLNLIHRDVALRNVLLDNNNICKICDFGLSCLNSSTQSPGRKFPLKWMAIESIKENVFSVKTDVWSYGILLWELFTLGDSPYNDIKSVLSYLESGQRLNKPNYCTDEIYVLMTSCWMVDPNGRPNFTDICKLLAKKIEAATKIKYNYVDALEFLEEISDI